MDNKQIRRSNLLALKIKYRTWEALSEITNVPASYLSQCSTGYRELGDKKSRAIEVGLKKPRGWMDSPIDKHTVEMERAAYEVKASPSAKSANQFTQIPILAWDEISNKIAKGVLPRRALQIEYATYPISRNGFAVIVTNDTMQDGSGRDLPSGNIVFADPDAKPLPNDIVIAIAPNEKTAILRKLVVDGDRLYLHALNKNYPIIGIESESSIVAVVTETKAPAVRLR
jgi:SOS-response transcriptional repressor LexA